MNKETLLFVGVGVILLVSLYYNLKYYWYRKSMRRIDTAIKSALATSITYVSNEGDVGNFETFLKKIFSELENQNEKDVVWNYVEMISPYIIMSSFLRKIFSGQVADALQSIEHKRSVLDTLAGRILCRPGMKFISYPNGLNNAQLLVFAFKFYFSERIHFNAQRIDLDKEDKKFYEVVKKFTGSEDMFVQHLLGTSGGFSYAIILNLFRSKKISDDVKKQLAEKYYSDTCAQYEQVHHLNQKEKILELETLKGIMEQYLSGNIVAA